MTDLSVIVVSYNTADITKRALDSLKKVLIENKSVSSEVLVVDNASTDGSARMLSGQQNDFAASGIDYSALLNNKNKGFGAANNQAIKLAKGRYILLLNSDVIVTQLNFVKLLDYLDTNPQIGALTVRVNLENGDIDPACHRGFPTLWRSFGYFSGLEYVTFYIPFLKRVFGGYHLTHLDLKKPHEIDSPSGAFYLARADVMKRVDGFDERFFMYGEDLDLSYRIKELGYKIVYLPDYQVLHLKHRSGLGHVNAEHKKMTKSHFYNAMKIFYDKHYAQKNPKLLNKLVYFFINQRNNNHGKTRH